MFFDRYPTLSMYWRDLFSIVASFWHNLPQLQCHSFALSFYSWFCPLKSLLRLLLRFSGSMLLFSAWFSLIHISYFSFVSLYVPHTYFIYSSPAIHHIFVVPYNISKLSHYYCLWYLRLVIYSSLHVRLFYFLLCFLVCIWKVL